MFKSLRWFNSLRLEAFSVYAFSTVRYQAPFTFRGKGWGRGLETKKRATVSSNPFLYYVVFLRKPVEVITS